MLNAKKITLFIAALSFCSSHLFSQKTDIEEPFKGSLLDLSNEPIAPSEESDIKLKTNVNLTLNDNQLDLYYATHANGEHYPYLKNGNTIIKGIMVDIDRPGDFPWHRPTLQFVDTDGLIYTREIYCFSPEYWSVWIFPKLGSGPYNENVYFRIPYKTKNCTLSGHLFSSDDIYKHCTIDPTYAAENATLIDGGYVYSFPNGVIFRSMDTNKCERLRYDYKPFIQTGYSNRKENNSYTFINGDIFDIDSKMYHYLLPISFDFEEGGFCRYKKEEHPD